MDKKKFYSLMKREEGQKLDFKLKLDLITDGGKKELAKDICAIANSNGGRGYIVVGVRDKSKRIDGIDKKDIFTEEQIQQIVSSRCEPPIPIEVDFLVVENKRLCVITIYNGEQKPYQIKDLGIFYVRRGSTTDTMRRSELIAAFEDNMELTVETSTVMRSDISLLNEDLLKLYFSRKGINFNEENRDFLLQSGGIVSYVDKLNTYKCTFGGLLVFSENNSLAIPNNMVKIVNVSKKDKSNEAVVIQGSLITIIDKCEKFIDSILPEDYPKIAVIEALKNAVLYREYTEINKFIEVNISDKNITIISPGAFIENDVSSFNKRNMWIYEKLITLDDKNRFLNNGKGLDRIKNAFNGKGKVKFINSMKLNHFKVVLPKGI